MVLPLLKDCKADIFMVVDSCHSGQMIVDAKAYFGGGTSTSASASASASAAAAAAGASGGGGSSGAGGGAGAGADAAPESKSSSSSSSSSSSATTPRLSILASTQVSDALHSFFLPFASARHQQQKAC